MQMTMKRLTLAFVSAGLMTFYGCGGGGSGSSATAPSSPAFQGTAATGAALANAIVAITNSAGNSPCTEASITTTALGSYTCTLKSGETAPFFVVVTDPTGNTSPLVSVAMTTPVAGSPLTVNVTPLTTAIVAQLSTDGNALTVVSSKTVDLVALKTVSANVVTQLSKVLTAINAPAGYDPFTTSITAATASNTGNTADMLLDVVKIVTDPTSGKLALSTVGDPTPIILATATTSGSSVAEPTAGVSTLSQAAQLSAQAFTACFALPTSQRVVNTTTPPPALIDGGPEVNDVDPACQNLTASLNSAAGMKFIHNGKSAGQFFYLILTSDSMTGAKFSTPEIMAFYPADSNNSRDRAILNIRYVDTAGNPGNVITIAANFPGTTSSTRPTNWWLVGNQQLVDTSTGLNFRRIEQMNTVSPPSTAALSQFRSGIQFIISTNGPKSNNYSSAQVTGPGLPTSGLWYFKNPNSSQPLMDLSSYRGASPSTLSPQYAVGGGCTSNCPAFWFGKTTGITASTNSYVTNPSSTYWSKGSGSGGDGSFNGVSGIRPKKGDIYTIKLYSGTTIYLTYTKVLLSDVVDPVLGSQLPWNTLGPKSNAALDPSNTSLNGPQSTLVLDWIQNVAAQQIKIASASTTDNGAYSVLTDVGKGLTSVTISATPNLFTGLSGTPSASNGFRGLYFNYRMQDGSIKSSVYLYN